MSERDVRYAQSVVDYLLPLALQGVGEGVAIRGRVLLALKLAVQYATTGRVNSELRELVDADSTTYVDVDVAITYLEFRAVDWGRRSWGQG